jgi:hypothetical protein
MVSSSAPLRSYVLMVVLPPMVVVMCRTGPTRPSLVRSVSSETAVPVPSVRAQTNTVRLGQHASYRDLSDRLTSCASTESADKHQTSGIPAESASPANEEKRAVSSVMN